MLPLHAEVEGGVFAHFLDDLLAVIGGSGAPVLTLEELARERLAASEPPPSFEACIRKLPGRASGVFAPAAT